MAPCGLTDSHRKKKKWKPSYYGGMLERVAEAELSKTDHSAGLPKIIYLFSSQWSFFTQT